METLKRLEFEARKAMNEATVQSGETAETVYGLAATVLNLVQHIRDQESAQARINTENHPDFKGW